MKETDIDTVVLDEDDIRKMVKPMPPAEPTDSGSEDQTS